MTTLRNPLKGLNVGLTVNEIKEILLQISAYAGFPRCLNDVGAFAEILDIRKKRGIIDMEGDYSKALPQDENRYEFGKNILTKLVGKPVEGPFFEFIPAIDKFLKEHIFADIFCRGILTYKEREVVTIAALSAMGGLSSQLESHLNIALNIGLTKEEIYIVISTIKNNFGEENGKIMEELFQKIFKN